MFQLMSLFQNIKVAVLVVVVTVIIIIIISSSSILSPGYIAQLNLNQLSSAAVVTELAS